MEFPPPSLAVLWFVNIREKKNPDRKKKVVKYSNVHFDFQRIQTTSEPDLVNYFKYLYKRVMNCTHQEHVRERRYCINISLNPHLW